MGHGHQLLTSLVMIGLGLGSAGCPDPDGGPTVTPPLDEQTATAPPEVTETAAATATASEPESTASETHPPTEAETPEATDFPTDPPTALPSAAPTATAEVTPEATHPPTAAQTASPTPTLIAATATPTSEATPTNAPTPTQAPTPTATRAPTPAPTQAPTPTATRAPTPTPTHASTPTATAEPTPTQASTPTATAEPTPTAPRAPTPTPTQPPTPTPTPTATAPTDADGDGFVAAVDCDDDNAAVNPGAEELPLDGLDNDCDGLVDNVDPSTLTSCPDYFEEGFEGSDLPAGWTITGSPNQVWEGTGSVARQTAVYSSIWQPGAILSPECATHDRYVIAVDTYLSASGDWGHAGLVTGIPEDGIESTSDVNYSYYRTHSDHVTNWNGGSGETRFSTGAIVNQVWYRYQLEVDKVAGTVVVSMDGVELGTVTGAQIGATGPRMGVMCADPAFFDNFTYERLPDIP